MKAKSKSLGKRGKSAGKGKRKPIMRHSREGMTAKRKGKGKPIMRHGREG